MTGFWNSAATSRKMWMLSASSSWRWLRRGGAMSGRMVLVAIRWSDCLWRLDFLRVQQAKRTVCWIRVWARLLFRGGDRVGGYLQHTHAHGQAIQQQKLLHARQAVLA